MAELASRCHVQRRRGFMNWLKERLLAFVEPGELTVEIVQEEIDYLLDRRARIDEDLRQAFLMQDRARARRIAMNTAYDDGYKGPHDE